MGNINVKAVNQTYLIEISDQTREILKKDESERYKQLLIKEAGSYNEQDLCELQKHFLDGHVTIAIFEGLITIPQALLLSKRSFLVSTFKDFGLTAFHDKLVTADDILKLPSSLYVEHAMSENGVFALRNNLMTWAGLCLLPSAKYLEHLFTDNGIKALLEEKITIEDAMKCNEHEELQTLINSYFVEVDGEQVAQQKDSVMVEHVLPRTENNKDTTKENNLKFHKAVRYLESNYIHDMAINNGDSSMLRKLGLESDREYASFRILIGRIFSIESYDSLCLLEFLISNREKIYHNYKSNYLLAKHNIIKSDTANIIDKTIAQCVNAGIFSADQIKSRNIYTVDELHGLLSAKYPEPTQVKPTLFPLSDEERQNPQKTRADVCDRLLKDEYPSFKEQKQDLLKLFSLRRYYQKEISLYTRLDAFATELDDFISGLPKNKGPYEEGILRKGRHLVIRSVLMSDEMLARMEFEALNGGCLENENSRLSFIYSANEIASQVGYIKFFSSSGITRLYHAIRGSLHNDVDLPSYKLLFYKNGAFENDLRKIYNTFIKYGFDYSYGEKSISGDIFQIFLTQIDSRYTSVIVRDKFNGPKSSGTFLQLFGNKNNNRGDLNKKLTSPSFSKGVT